MLAVLKALNISSKALVVTAGDNANVELSSRNIVGIKPVVANGINVYDVLAHDKLIITKDAVNQVQEVFA
jgi:large subunit ribosomal protein L4